MKVYFITLGCKVNQYETNLMAEQFEQKGYEIITNKNEEIADIYVINSCSVTNLSTRKSRQALSRARKLNSNAIIVLCGCYAEETSFTLKKTLNISNVDLVLGNEEKKEIVKYVEEYINQNKEKRNISFKVGKTNQVKRYISAGKLTQFEKVRESIKIEDGCNNFCTYCIIPYTRGRVRSRNLKEIEDEVKKLADENVKEIVLVGIEIAAYGKDLKKDLDDNSNQELSLIDVIEKVNNIDKIERIRLSSMDPRFFTDENIEKIAYYMNNGKLCNHIHLSVQSLSDTVLKRMNRKYTSKYIEEITTKLRSKVKDITFTCDIIVGFIDETKEEFMQTYNMCKKINFSDMHIFKFSKRENTAAYNMKSCVTEKEQDERSKQIINLGKILQENVLKQYTGTKQKVLIDERIEDGYYLRLYIKLYKS